MKVSLKLVGLFSAFLGMGLSFSSPSWARFGNPALANTDEERNAVYLDVYNSDDVAHEEGDVVVFNDGSYDGIQVSTTTTANNSLVAGVVAPGVTCAASSWGCKIQIAGYHPAITIAAGVTAGDGLVTSSTGEAAQSYTIAQATGALTNQATSYGVFGVALETTGGSTVKGFLFR